MTHGDAAIARTLHDTLLNPGTRAYVTKPGTNPADEDMYMPVEGFTYLGEGCSRIAYLHDATGIVYKHGSGNYNMSEWSKSKELAQLPWNADSRFDTRIPWVEVFPDVTDSVIAMEYAKDCIPSQCDSEDWTYNPETGMRVECPCSCTMGWCHTEAWSILSAWSDIYDMHWGNALWNRETLTYFLVDLAC